MDPETEGSADQVDPTGEAGRPAAGVSRRHMLAAVGAGALVAGTVGAGAGAAYASSHVEAPPPPEPAPTAATVAFFGPHQAGIVTPAQDRLHFAAFDITAESRDDVISLLRDWTIAAARMTQGLPAGRYAPDSGPYQAPPDDTGEAQGLSAAKLTLTFGFGPGLFRTAAGADRFGLAGSQPAALRELPHFPGDNLDPARSGGDLCVQACADDPQVAVHAIRNLARIAFGRASVRWSQLGFGRTSSTSTAQATPRNLFGFKDGTANLKAEDDAAVNEQVWVGRGDDPSADWLAGGSYLVARRISMHIEPWDRTSLGEQEAIIGRDKGDGAPLSGGTEFTPINFTITGQDDKPLVALDSHVRLAHPDQNDGSAMLRRGYNFTDGSDGLGRLDAGLFFLAYVRNPAVQYIPMQTKLARDDALSEYLLHTGSALFAVPPGAPTESEFVGQALFG